MNSEKLNTPSSQWWGTSCPWSLSLAVVSSVVLPESKPDSESVSLSMSDSRSLLCLLSWASMMPWWTFPDEAFQETEIVPTIPQHWGLPVQAHCYKGQSGGVKEMKKQAQLLLWEQLFQPHPLITSMNLGAIIGYLWISGPVLKLGLHWVSKKLLDFIWTLCPTVILCGLISPRNCSYLKGQSLYSWQGLPLSSETWRVSVGTRWIRHVPTLKEG